MYVNVKGKIKLLYSFSFQEKNKFLIPVLLATGSSFAQVVNKGEVGVKGKTILSIYEDYSNIQGSQLINDGEVYIFQNWDNDGLTSYNKESDGSTFFIGRNEQIIEGDETSNFSNVIFNNTSKQVPFHLASKISVNKKALFENGIIDAKEYDGEVIFNENAMHEKGRDKSFVRGRVKKLGEANFEYPVGDDLFYRPALHSNYRPSLKGIDQNALTVEYFKKNSGNLHSHSNKQDEIISIDDAEYWQVDQNSGTEKIVLSLTLDEDTTPYAFLNVDSNYMLAIVRWDEKSAKWISEGGVVSDPAAGGDYQKLITSQVSGYGLFTIALIKKTKDDDLGDIVIYNGITPDGDGLNDNFHIKGIDNYPDNRVEIYNRWGVLVYDQDGYNESDKMFRGYSEGRVTIDKSSTLPTGTYFYILKYKKGDKMIDKSGYLYINAK